MKLLFSSGGGGSGSMCSLNLGMGVVSVKIDRAGFFLNAVTLPRIFWTLSNMNMKASDVDQPPFRCSCLCLLRKTFLYVCAVNIA